MAEPPVVGFIGLGAIGRPMAERILERFSLVACDLRPDACAPLAGRARIASTPAEVAAGSDIVFACLPTLGSYREVVSGEAGLLAGGRAGLYVHVGTTGSALVRELESALAGVGVRTLDAPMTGGVPRARDGTLTVMASGPAEAFAAALPVMECYASKIVHLDGGTGSAQILKLINNVLSAANLALAAEALLMGSKAGLDCGQMIEVLNSGTGQSDATRTKIPRHVLSGRFDYGGALHITLKDLAAYLEEASALGVPAPLGSVVRQAYVRAAALGSPLDDMTSVVCHMEQASGAELRARAHRDGAAAAPEI